MVGATVPRSVPRLSSLPGPVLALCGLALSAGTIHLVATIEHLGEDRLAGLFFVIVGVAQLLAARWIYRRPGDRRMLAATAAGSAAVALLWVLSRTTGLPFGLEGGDVSKVGVADTIATLQELAFAAVVAGLLWRPERGGPRLAWLSSGIGVRLTYAVLTAALFTAAIGGHEH